MIWPTLTADQRTLRSVGAVVAALLALAGCQSGRTDATERADRADATEASGAGSTPLPGSVGSTSPVATHDTSNNSTTTPAAAATATDSATTTTTTPTVNTSTTTSTTTSTASVPPPVGPVACPPSGTSIWEIRLPSDLPPPELPTGWSAEAVGSSVQGRDIMAFVRSVDVPRRRVLVVGGLHGNEPVSPPAVRGLIDARLAADIEVWLVPEANPDGVAAGSRCNANGVDLNRNFAWHWRADDGGPMPISEPETQTLVDLVDRLSPDIVVWVHQPYGYVSSIGATDSSLESAWADAAGVPVRPDVTQHGGGESWTAFTAGVPAMLIEIDSWSATQEIVAAHRAGYEAMIEALG